jgi:hypothetical protein
VVLLYYSLDADIEEELDSLNADTLEESLQLRDFPIPILFWVNETETPNGCHYILKRHEDASPTDISCAYLTVIDDSNRDVANKINKTKLTLQ